MNINLDIVRVSKDGAYINLTYKILRDNSFIISDTKCSISLKDLHAWANSRGITFPENPGEQELMANLAVIKNYLGKILNLKYIQMYWDQNDFISELKNDIRKIILDDEVGEVIVEKKPMIKATGNRNRANGGKEDRKEAV